MSTPAEKKKKQVEFQEVSETVNRLAAHKGVTGVLILNLEGDILTQTTTPEVVGNPKLLARTLMTAKTYIQSIPQEQQEEKPTELSFLRIRTTREEVLVAPKYDYVLVVLQDPNSAPL